MAPDASAEASVMSARPLAKGIGRSAGASPAIVATSGKTCVSAPPAAPGPGPPATDSPPAKPAASMDPASGVPHSATSRAPSRRAAATDTCCPSTALMAISLPSTAPTARRPGQSAASGPITGSSVKNPEIAHGSASRSSSRRHRCTAAVTSRRSDSASEQSTQLAPGTERRERTPIPFGRLTVLLYSSGEATSMPGMARAARKPNMRLRSIGGRNGSRRCSTPVPALAARTRRAAWPVPAAPKAACHTPQASSR